MRTIAEIVDELLAMLQNLSIAGALTEEEEKLLNDLLFEYEVWASMEASKNEEVN